MIATATPDADRGPRRRTAALAAIPRASTASPSAEPRGLMAPRQGSKAQAKVVAAARIASAWALARRSQPRTVAGGRPSAPAILRCPSPAALATSAATITSAASRRRGTAQAGKITWLAPQRLHHALRGRSRRSPSKLRTTRALAHPKRPSGSLHLGHATRRWASSSSASVPSRSTSTPAPLVGSRDVPVGALNW